MKYGRATTNDGIILKTTDGGASWQSTPIPGACTDVVFVNPGTGYLATSTGPLHTYNAGANWQPYFGGSNKQYCLKRKIYRAIN